MDNEKERITDVDDLMQLVLSWVKNILFAKKADWSTVYFFL